MKLFSFQVLYGMQTHLHTNTGMDTHTHTSTHTHLGTWQKWCKWKIYLNYITTVLYSMRECENWIHVNTQSCITCLQCIEMHNQPNVSNFNIKFIWTKAHYNQIWPNPENSRYRLINFNQMASWKLIFFIRFDSTCKESLWKMLLLSWPVGTKYRILCLFAYYFVSTASLSWLSSHPPWS